MSDFETDMSPVAESPGGSAVSKNRWLLVALLLVLGVATLVTIWLAVASVLSGYLTGSSPALWAGFSAGAGLIVWGGVESLRRPATLTGPVLMILGISWLGIELVGWAGGPQLVRTGGLLLGPLLVPALAHLALLYPGNRVSEASHRLFVLTTYVAALGVGIGRVVFYDPFYDVDCWRTCIHSDLVPFPNPQVADSLDLFWLVVASGALVLTVILVVRRALIAARSGGVWAWYVLVPVAVAAGAQLTAAPLTAVSLIEQPEANLFRIAFLVESAALNAIWLGAAWGMSLTRRIKKRLRTLAADLEATPKPGALRDLLAASLGDETLEVAYWLPEVGGHIAPDGSVVDVIPRPDRSITSIERGGESLGVVTFSSSLATADLERQIGSAARLAIGNERLRAGLLAQMRQLRASQEGIVETGDAARKRIERNLHDGAQQRLLALSYDLRLALSAATENTDPTVSTLTRASDEVGLALLELRELAHGIFPSILADAGLAAALEGLAETSSLPVEWEAVDERFPATVEMAAYQAGSECVTIAEENGASSVGLSAFRVDDDLILEVWIEDGRLSPADLVRVSDRVGAAGGNLVVEDDRVRAVIPCG